MSTKYPREFFGVSFIYLRQDVVKKANKIIVNGSRVWALLPDGRIATNADRLFKFALSNECREMAHVAEVLWRFGKIDKNISQEILAKVTVRENLRHKINAGNDLKYYAETAGIALTQSQLNKIAALKAAGHRK